MRKKRGFYRKKKGKIKIIDYKNPEDEYELQAGYHKYLSTTYPNTISCGTPYCNMPRGTATKVRMKGYLPGYPDYVEHDPRLIVQRRNDVIRLKIIPGRVIEFKSPNGKGRVSPNQKNVLENLRNRGFYTSVISNLHNARIITQTYKRCIPIYRGWITIDLKSGNITFPKRKRGEKTLPGRKLQKHHHKMKRLRRVRKAKLKLKLKRRVMKRMMMKKNKKGGMGE